MALMVIPDLGHGHAAVFKSLYLGLCLLWSLPLAALQRALWRRGLAWWRLLGVVFAVTYAMAVANNLAGQSLAIAMGWRRDPVVQWTSLLGGLESCWLALLAAGAAHAVLAYAYRLRREQAQHLAARAAMRDAELRALRYQLQPHFLFNTLNAVSALVAERRNTEAQAMIARLGDFLRGTLAAPQAHEVPLGEEIAAAEDYLDIERARLGERLRLHWQVGPDVLRALAPRLLLQPLIENAIRHGIAPGAGAGRLEIAASRDGDRLRLQIINDVADGRVDTDTDTDDGGGIGLRNLRERLQALYPDDHAFSADADGGEFRVAMDLPWREPDGHRTPEASP
ncbi:MAG: histidine kinase [Proteobacteria bacterium]|nr:histidine kinase [Pseudomonadota bacterium]